MRSSLRIWGIEQRFWGIRGRLFFHAFLAHAKWMAAYPEIRKIYDEKNEVIVYFDQRGPDKPTMSHGAYTISTTKKRLQESRNSEKLVRSKHPIGTQRVQRMAYSRGLLHTKMEDEDLGDVEMNRLEKTFRVDRLEISDSFFMPNGQPSWSGANVSHQLNPLPTYSWILINVFFYLL